MGTPSLYEFSMGLLCGCVLNAILPGHYCFYNTSRHILWSWRSWRILSFSQFTGHTFCLCARLVKPTVEHLKIQSEKQMWCTTKENKLRICANMEKLFGSQSSKLSSQNLSRWIWYHLSTFLWRLPRFHDSDVSKDELPWGKLGMSLRHGRDRRRRRIVQEGLDLQGQQPFQKHHSLRTS